jgi:hypothetical protein
MLIGKERGMAPRVPMRPRVATAGEAPPCRDSSKKGRRRGVRHVGVGQWGRVQ